MVAGLGVLAGWFLACAGQDIPPVDDDLRGAIADGFGGNAPSASAGSGSGSAGRGGSGSGNAGSGNDNGGDGGSANTAGSDTGGGAGGGEPVGGGGGGGGGAVCEAFDTIILERCGSAGCHNEGAAVGEFGASEALAATFVDEPSTAATCDSLIIDSANPEDSLIYTKLFNPIPTGCGNLQMPVTGDFLTEEESDCILSWLQQFAE